MQTIRMKLQDMRKPEKNIRSHTERQLQEYERSIKMFGQIRPIVVDEGGMILAGVGLYDALIRMGRDEADVYQLDGLSEEGKKKLMIADNKIFNLGVDNLTVLNEFIEDLKDDLDIPGFDEDILKDMVADAEAVTESISEYGKLEKDEIDEIRDVGKRQEEKIERANAAQGTVGTAFQGSADADDNPQADVRRFVVCPKCGEKIWL